MLCMCPHTAPRPPTLGGSLNTPARTTHFYPPRIIFFVHVLWKEVHSDMYQPRGTDVSAVKVDAPTGPTPTLVFFHDSFGGGTFRHVPPTRYRRQRGKGRGALGTDTSPRFFRGSFGGGTAQHVPPRQVCCGGTSGRWPRRPMLSEASQLVVVHVFPKNLVK
jgi:hypothetical protein